MRPPASVTVDERDDVVVARLSGEIDLANAREGGGAIRTAVPNAAHGLVVDLTAVEYLDSSGIQLLFELAEQLRNRQQQLRVVLPEDAPIGRVLDLVGLEASVPVFRGLDAAVEDLRAAAS